MDNLTDNLSRRSLFKPMPSWLVQLIGTADWYFWLKRLLRPVYKLKVSEMKLIKWILSHFTSKFFSRSECSQTNALIIWAISSTLTVRNYSILKGCVFWRGAVFWRGCELRTDNFRIWKRYIRHLKSEDRENLLYPRFIPLSFVEFVAMVWYETQF